MHRLMTVEDDYKLTCLAKKLYVLGLIISQRVF